MPKTIMARINPEINIIFVTSWREIYHLTLAVVLRADINLHAELTIKHE